MKKILIIALFAVVFVGCGARYDYNKFITEYNDFVKADSGIVTSLSVSNVFKDQKKHYKDLLASDKFEKWKTEKKEVLEVNIDDAPKETKELMDNQKKLLEDYVNTTEELFTNLSNAKDEESINKINIAGMAKANKVKNDFNTNMGKLNDIIKK